MSRLPRARIAGILAPCLLLLSATGALAGTVVPNYQPDAQIALSSPSSFVGDNIYNADASGQQVSGFGPVGSITPIYVLIENDGALLDSFKVSRSSGYTSGFRVRYYDINGTDVTGRVNVGSFTTPALASGADYVMKVKVKVRPGAAPCAQTSRLITVRSVGDSSFKDAVRFTMTKSPC